MNTDSISNGDVILESFANPTHTWSAMNDPVMGGKSFSTVSIENNLGLFDGEVVDVPFLHAPGFITMRGNGDYPDVSSCQNLELIARASEPYSGYRVSFGERSVPGNRFARGYKADFDAPVLGDSEMATIVIPFHDFTVRWDDATGDAVVTCEENEDFCPDSETLKNMKTISLWGEGVAGKVHLEIDSIKATGCSGKGITRETNTGASDSSNNSNLLSAPVLVLLAGVAAFSSALSIRRRRATKSYDGINNRDSPMV